MSPPSLKLNRELIQRLASCEYITEHRNLFITGATGSGKTYLACALGMEACKQHYRTLYVRLPDLLLDLEIARSNGTYKKTMAKYARPVLLILDEELAQVSGGTTGTVKAFNNENGFSFIQPEDGGKDVFVHREPISRE